MSDDLFVKTQLGATTEFFAAEARGLELLRVDGGPPLPGVRQLEVDRIVLDRITPGHPSEAAAREFGRRLATMHSNWLPRFGAPAPGFVGPLRLDNEPLDGSAADEWPTFYAQRRLRPYLTGLDNEVHAAVERVIEHLPDLAGPPERPARIHGDLWSGNLLWGADGQVWLVDAASAHGGHRETDLAMLALFGAPHHDAIVSAYQETAPLADGWRERVPLHQLHPLLVHAHLFGGHYCQSVVHQAKAAMSPSTGAR